MERETHECVGHGCDHQSHDTPSVDGDLMPAAHLKAEMANDLVGKIMAKRYSEGGRVANEDAGASASEPDRMAKDDPNEFDDLALRDDLESSYTGADSGDELGNRRESDDEADIISRVMRSRGKRDRMAVSGEGSTYGKRK